MPLHQKLTMAHFALDPAGKMRNHLAEEVLNMEMLRVMTVCTFSYNAHERTINPQPSPRSTSQLIMADVLGTFVHYKMAIEHCEHD